MWKNVEHIGIAVKDLESVNEIYTKLFGESPYKMESVETEQVDTSFFKVGNTKIEFLSASNENSAIAKFIEKRGEGIHHIAFEVEDIHYELDRLQKEGFQFTRPEVSKGADNKLVCFIHPKSANGVLVELCQEIRK
ncbi:methylmalonyl-CoA epimerase [Ekhidna sp.]|uniref:methylmalonyl-CoA epimerase n=1 Tax=Ekhidna sp. TaxID=2608089 RepID=UPI0035111A2A